MKIIDTRGEVCPKPIIMTKKELGKMAVNEHFMIYTDNETSLNNLLRFLKDNTVQTELLEGAPYYQIKCLKMGLPNNEVPPESYCSVNNEYIVVFKSNKMGEGSDDLGAILIKGFINTLKEADRKPKAMIFYNSGVLLTKYTEPLSITLQALEESGVSLIICGTCADFYQIKDEIKIGTISNMFEIVNQLSQFSHIVTP